MTHRARTAYDAIMRAFENESRNLVCDDYRQVLEKVIVELEGREACLNEEDAKSAS